MDKKDQVKRIFDAISPKYDFLNHFLSVGIDLYWRKKALRLTGIDGNSSLLDVACGTGDFSIAAKKMGVTKIIGIDLSKKMLGYFNQKVEWSKGKLIQSVAEYIPIKEDTFSNITVAFGVRNFFDISKGFDSFYRILECGGKLTILEFRLPKNKIIKNLYLLYFNKILPFIGRTISKDKEAYSYLPESVDSFDSNINLNELLRNSGFQNIENHSLTLGIVQVVIAKK
jgi:demethylmenaquinone methyltransferase/2-methoxy-6-polyprenyl-1,4-benzoquinol methylase